MLTPHTSKIKMHGSLSLHLNFPFLDALKTRGLLEDLGVGGKILNIKVNVRHVGFVVDDVAVEQVFSEYFVFPC
jgi:hypothetical protein